MIQLKWKEKFPLLICIVLAVSFPSLGYKFSFSTLDVSSKPMFRQNTSASAGEELECKNATGQFEHPKYCDFFINCWEGVPMVDKCPKNLVFNEARSACDFPENVDCKGREINQTDKIDPRCMDRYGTYANPMDCNEYFVCRDGVVLVKKCPKFTYFRPEEGNCPETEDPNCYRLLDPCFGSNSPGCKCQRQQEAANGGSKFPSFVGGRPQKPPRNCNFEPHPTIGNDPRCEEPSGTFRNYKNCTEYYECNWARAVVKSCPKDTYFRPEYQGRPSQTDQNCFFLLDPCIVPQSRDCMCQNQHAK